jgi:hypothetical protein
MKNIIFWDLLPYNTIQKLTFIGIGLDVKFVSLRFTMTFKYVIKHLNELVIFRKYYSLIVAIKSTVF